MSRRETEDRGGGAARRSESSDSGDAPPAPGRTASPPQPPTATGGTAEAAGAVSDARAEREGRGDGGGGDAHLRRSRDVLTTLFGPPGRRGFAVRYWDAGRDPASGDPPFTLVLTWPGALRRMLLPPTERSLGGAFVRGHVEVEGDLEAAVRRVRPAVRRLWSVRRASRVLADLWSLPRRPEQELPGEDPRGAPPRRGRRHSRGRDARAVRYHYDLGNDFYRLWLDPWMQYSSGWFREGDESLREAQEAKLELVCRQLRLEAGDRLLDVGCGWGGLIHYAAERHGVEAVGVTLSEPQARAARRRLQAAGLADRCRILVTDYRELDGVAPFDRAVSVGMVEHVGHREMGRYFRHVRRSLAPGGLFLNQGIVTLDPAPPWRRRLRERLTAPWTSFIDRYVFPDGELVTPAERIGPAGTAGFELRSVRSLREHYAATLRRWVRRLEDHREEAVEEAGLPTYRVWRLYMAAAARAFDAGEIGVIQELYRKPDRAAAPGG